MRQGLTAYLFAFYLLFGIAYSNGQAAGASTQELRQQVNDLQQQLKKVQARLDELEAAKASGSAVQEPNAPASQPSASQAGQPSLEGTSPQVGAATSAYTTFAEDSIAAPRYDNVLLDSKHRGFFALPGTQMVMKIGGYAKTDVIYDLKPAGNAYEFITSSIPVPETIFPNNANVSVRPTRLDLDFRYLSNRIGEVRFYVEGDFFGTNATTPRLRHAYAQAQNLLIGQTFTNFMDPDGFPDTLDFEGPNGLVNLRNPQVRYGFALSPSLTFNFAAERPSSDIAFTTPEFDAQPNSPSPDGTVRLRKEFQSGHLQIAGIFRSVAAFVTSGNNAKADSVFGWGVNVSSGFKTFGKDNVIIAAAFGHGISRYIQDTSGLGIDAEVTSSGTNPHLEATPAVGADASYQHYWTKRLRSSVVYSYAAVQNARVSSFVPATTYNHATYTAANLIWNPYSSAFSVGAEFLYGWKMLQDGSKGNAPRIQLSAKYNFIRLGSD